MGTEAPAGGEETEGTAPTARRAAPLPSDAAPQTDSRSGADGLRRDVLDPAEGAGEVDLEGLVHHDLRLPGRLGHRVVELQVVLPRLDLDDVDQAGDGERQRERAGHDRPLRPERV